MAWVAPPVELGVVVDGFRQLVIGFVRRVILEYIQDEAFLHRLPHRVEVERLGFAVDARAAEEFQGLMLGRCRECEETQVLLGTTGFDRLDNLFLGVEFDGCRLILFLGIFQVRGREHLSQVGGR